MRVVGILIGVILLGVLAWLGYSWLGPTWSHRGQADIAIGLSAPPGTPALPELVQVAVANKQLMVAWTAQAGAHLEPCGCVAGMHGGLARRGSLLTRVDRNQRLTVECGGWSGGAVDHQRIRARYYLAALATVGYDAVGLGRAEIALGADNLNDILRDAKVPILAANVSLAATTASTPTGTPPPSGAPQWAPYRDVEYAGQRFRLTAVVPATSRGDGLVVGDPAEALLPIVATAGDAQIIVLADSDSSELTALAKAVPGLALVIGGAVSQPSQQPLSVGPTRIVFVANAGKTLGWWPWRADNCAFELIEDSVPDVPEVRSIIRRYQDDLATHDLAVDDAQGLASLGGSRAAYVGDAACMTCHAAAHTIHEATRHAHAFATLAAKHYDADPDCLRCHVTGLGTSDGFRRQAGASSPFARVGCEACHGPGGDHVRERQAGQVAGGTLSAVTPATCMRCHDGDNSPNFSYVPYWEKIHHGLR